MTQEQIETIITQLQQQVQLNTTAIQQLSNQFNNYATVAQYTSLVNTVNATQASITNLQSQVASLQTSIGLVNKLSKLIDTNITSIAKDDLLQWDGDRWTNIQPSKLGITSTGGSSTLEGLSDVSITNKSDGQALVWSNSSSRWVNRTISTGSGTGTGGGLTVTQMWEELGNIGDNQINPTHITGSLNLSGLKVSGSTTLTGVTVNGNALATGEITAYS